MIVTACALVTLLWGRRVPSSKPTNMFGLISLTGAGGVGVGV